MKTRLLLVMPSLGSGGAEKSFVSLLELLPRDLFDISVMVVNEGGLFYSHVPVDVERVEAPRKFRIALGSIHSSFMKQECCWLERAVKVVSNILVRLRGITRLDLAQFTWKLWRKSVPVLAGEWDVAVSFMNGMTNYYVIDKVTASRKYLWVHNDYKMLKTSYRFDNIYWQKADNVVTISNACVKSLEECFPKLKGKFICLENISSSKMIRSMADDECPAEFQELDRETLRLLSVGRLAEQKGFDMAVDAAAILKSRGVCFRWLIIGVGVLRDNLQHQIDNNGLTNSVFLLGERSNPYVYMKWADILVQSSRYEGKSIVVDEAKILCLPIIATNYPSVGDNIEDGISGLVCHMDPDGIADAIEHLSYDKVLRMRLSENLAKERSVNEREIEKYVWLFKGNSLKS